MQMFDYPPYPYLYQVALYCPKAVITYMQLWEKRNKNSCKTTIIKSDLKNQYLTTATKLKNDLLLLMREGLLSIVEETSYSLVIELVDFDEDEAAV